MKDIIISFLVTKFILNIVFFQLNRYNPNLFKPLKNMTEKWQDKPYLRWTLSFILIFICSLISSYLNLSYVISGIFIALVLSLNDIAWNRPRN